MNPSARKTEIIRATNPIILRNGIRAVRIDDIAAEIGKNLGCTREKGYIIPGTDIALFGEMLQHIIYEGRLSRYPCRH